MKTFAMICLSPLLGILIVIGMALLWIGDKLLSIISWPYRVIGGLIETILGGGSR